MLEDSNMSLSEVSRQSGVNRDTLNRLKQSPFAKVELETIIKLMDWALTWTDEYQTLEDFIQWEGDHHPGNYGNWKNLEDEI